MNLISTGGVNVNSVVNDLFNRKAASSVVVYL